MRPNYEFSGICAHCLYANPSFQVFTELTNTPEYKAELAAIEEEKRKKNEPLNKAALERMIKRYSAHNLAYVPRIAPECATTSACNYVADCFCRRDNDLNDRWKAYPELQLIGSDPKV